MNYAVSVVPWLVAKDIGLPGLSNFSIDNSFLAGCSYPNPGRYASSLQPPFPNSEFSVLIEKWNQYFLEVKRLQCLSREEFHQTEQKTKDHLALLLWEGKAHFFSRCAVNDVKFAVSNGWFPMFSAHMRVF